MLEYLQRKKERRTLNKGDVHYMQSLPIHRRKPLLDMPPIDKPSTRGVTK